MLEVNYKRTDRTTKKVDGRTITTEVTEAGKRPLEIPTKWAMYTAAGNLRVTQIAREAHKKCTALAEKIRESSYDEYKARRDAEKILVNMLYKWERMSDHKSYREASDTAVRECIGDFHDQLWDATVGDWYGCQSGFDLWDNHLDKAYTKHRKFTEKKAS